MSAQPQHMQALERANQIRSARAAVMQRLRTGEARIGDVDLDAPELQSMTVLDLLGELRYKPYASSRYKPRAKHRPRELMYAFGCSPRTLVGDLSAARKRGLVALVQSRVALQSPYLGETR